jgi:hypothetical protein
MAGGFTNPELGYLTFAGIKLVGYSIAGYILNRAYNNAKNFFLVVGVARTLIGLIFGAAIGILLIGDLIFEPLGILLYFTALTPLRIVEWWIVIWWFYDRQSQQRKKDWSYVWYGTGWSFVLDIPAFIGWFSTAGFWIC